MEINGNGVVTGRGGEVLSRGVERRERLRTGDKRLRRAKTNHRRPVAAS
ncbi:MAG: hypothetical protein MZV70_42965 [Desulfobacterales bacterium]|nr:hypothetical protein [Desulfobacterales bacterium]